MKAAVLYKDKAGLVIEQMAIPIPSETEILVKVEACGVCGTDVHLVEKKIPTSLDPVIPGHEIWGKVSAMGSAVNGFRVGDRVLVFPQRFCGECYACNEGSEELCIRPKIIGMDMNGGFAEYVSVPQEMVLAAPVGLDTPEAALFSESLAVVFHAIFVNGNVQSKETILLIGVGGLGTNAVKMLSALGDVNIICADINDAALQRAKELGANEIINTSNADLVQWIRERGIVIDCAIEFVGRPETIKTGYKALKKGGRIVLVGVGMERPDFGPLIAMVASGKRIIPSFGFSIQSTRDLQKFVEQHKLSFSDSVSEIISLSDANQAIQTLQSGRSVVRLVIRP